MLVAYLATAAGLGSGMLLSQANTLFALKIGIGAGVLSAFIIVPLLQRKLTSSGRLLWLIYGTFELLVFIVTYYLVASSASC